MATVAHCLWWRCWGNPTGEPRKKRNHTQHTCTLIS